MIPNLINYLPRYSWNNVFNHYAKPAGQFIQDERTANPIKAGAAAPDNIVGTPDNIVVFLHSLHNVNRISH